MSAVTPENLIHFYYGMMKSDSISHGCTIQLKKEIDDLQDLQRYYTENKEALKGYYDRGIDIPETREPGVIHHACLGGMESNVFTYIGNRMKDGRCCWSIDGGNNLAVILCGYHSNGLEYIFAVLPEVPAVE